MTSCFLDTFEILFKKLLDFQRQFSGNDLCVMKTYKILNHLLPFALVYVCNNDVVCKEIEDTSIDISINCNYADIVSYYEHL